MTLQCDPAIDGLIILKGRNMSNPTPNLPDGEAEKFALAVGKALQNCGTIEYLVNEILAKIVRDSIIVSQLTKMGIAKRLDILESLVKREWDDVQALDTFSADVYAKAKAVFQNRNKIAHNPLVMKVHHTEGDRMEIGIHVMRYAESGVVEEWLYRERIEEFTKESQPLMLAFNSLLGFYSTRNAAR